MRLCVSTLKHNCYRLEKKLTPLFMQHSTKKAKFKYGAEEADLAEINCKKRKRAADS